MKNPEQVDDALLQNLFVMYDLTVETPDRKKASVRDLLAKYPLRVV